MIGSTGSSLMVITQPEEFMSNRTSKVLLTLTGAALLAAVPALAQTASQPATGHGQGQMPVTPPQAAQASAQSAQNSRGTIIPAEKASQIRAGKLLGMKVVNSIGKETGTVDDIVIDKDGKVSGLVIKTGGFLGIGGKAVAIAWRDVGSTLQSNVVNVSLTEAALDKAPDFKTTQDQLRGKSAPHASAGPMPLQPTKSPSP